VKVKPIGIDGVPEEALDVKSSSILLHFAINAFSLVFVANVPPP
jgi:hypothetical protein